jgi:hypothetical protein
LQINTFGIVLTSTGQSFRIEHATIKVLAQSFGITLIRVDSVSVILGRKFNTWNGKVWIIRVVDSVHDRG